MLMTIDRPGDPRIDLMAGECEIVRTEEVLASGRTAVGSTANGNGEALVVED